MTYHQLFKYSNKTGVTSGAGTVCPYGVPEVTPVLVGVVLRGL